MTFATFTITAILMSVYAAYRDRLRELNRTTAGQRRSMFSEGGSSSLERREEI